MLARACVVSGFRDHVSSIAAKHELPTNEAEDISSANHLPEAALYILEQQ